MMLMFINFVIATISRHKCAIAFLSALGVIMVKGLSAIFSDWFRIKKSSRYKRRCKLGSSLWTRRKVMWKQRRLTRTAYVVSALQSLNEAEKSRELKALYDIGKMVSANRSRTEEAKGEIDAVLKADSGGKADAESTRDVSKKQNVLSTKESANANSLPISVNEAETQTRVKADCGADANSNKKMANAQCTIDR